MRYLFRIGTVAISLPFYFPRRFHVVNVPSALSFITNIALKNAPEKIRKRVKFYSSFDHLTIIDKKSLPKEYGGTIPMAEMASKFVDFRVTFSLILIDILCRGHLGVDAKEQQASLLIREHGSCRRNVPKGLSRRLHSNAKCSTKLPEFI